MRKTKSAILEAVHETAKGLHAAGVMEQVTLREFDRLCLPPVEPLSPGKIRKIRVWSHFSQAVFAALPINLVKRYPNTVQRLASI